MSRRLKWIAAIKNEQNFDFSINHFNVCNLHFRQSDFNKSGKLNLEAVPNKFDAEIMKEKLNESDLIEHNLKDSDITKFDPEYSSLTLCSGEIICEPMEYIESENIFLAELSDENQKNDNDHSNSISHQTESENKSVNRQTLEKDVQILKLQNKIKTLEGRLSEKNKKIKALSEQRQRDQKKYQKLKEDRLSSIEGDAGYIIDCLIGNSKLRFSKPVREFALTLDFYSHRAYEYVRDKFDHNLPHISTIRKWYANSSANGEPGISREAIDTLTKLVVETKAEGKEFYCSLCFDETMIRQHVQYIDSQKQFSGLTTYGNRGDDLPIAKNAIVFMVNGINKQISLPVAHHFIGNLNAKEKADLLKMVITAITQTNAKIINVTCDGLVTNFAMFKRLGASFKPDNLQTYFPNPVDESRIYIMLDACHMLKLARNCILNEKRITDGNNHHIEWLHFERLERIRRSDGFITHKLTKKHIECENYKQKVILAAQTISRSVANSMEYLMSSQYPSFQNCAGTIRFARQINDLFDVFNTGFSDTPGQSDGNVFKTMLSLENADQILPFLSESTDYIKSLKVNGTNILRSSKKTGFLGFLMNIICLREIFEQFVKTGKLVYIPTFSLSQDQLEAFFGRIRSKCGFNRNPTAEQFKSAFRKIIVNTEIRSSNQANCLDNLNIYSVASTSKSVSGGNPNSNQLKHREKIDTFPINDCFPGAAGEACEFSEVNEPSGASEARSHQNASNIGHSEILNNFSANDCLLSAASEASLCRLAYDIEQKIRSKGRFECDHCLNIFNVNDKVTINFASEAESISACVSTIHICKIVNKYLNRFKEDFIFNYTKLLTSVLNQIDENEIFSKSDFSLHQEHKSAFIIFIAEECIRIQATQIARDLTLQIFQNNFRKS